MKEYSTEQKAKQILFIKVPIGNLGTKFKKIIYFLLILQ
jgi:hypothetical protein